MFLIAGLASAALLTGCASEPTIDTSPEAEPTFDGLYEVKGSRADQAWARPGFDLSQYSKIMLKGAGVEYRAGGEKGRAYKPSTRKNYFEIPPEQKQAFEALMREKFAEELAKSKHYTLVSEPGPDVLLIYGALLDVVSFVPPDPVGSRADIYLSEVGQATLVLEIRDSNTGAALARAVDRRAAESAVGFIESNRVSNRAEIRRLAQTWARILRERLDEYGAPQE